MNVDEIRKLCAEAIEADEAATAEDEEYEDEAPDFGGNVDDALRSGETRGETRGAADIAKEILKHLT